jgi:hypothetical protein
MQQLGALHARLEALHSTGRETQLFAMPFIHQMHHFTKTGSGQNTGKVLKKRVAFR